MDVSLLRRQPVRRIPGLVKTAGGVVGVVGSLVAILVSLGVVGGSHGASPSAPQVIRVDTGPPTGAPTLDRYVGPQFSLRYPRGWRISSPGAGSDGTSATTIASPSTPGLLVRVDVSTGSADAPSVVALRALAVAAANPGYRKLDLGVTTVAGFDGVRWDYLLSRGDVELRRTEVVFTDARGNGYALVEQAPAASFARWQGVFDDVRDSLVPAPAW